MDEIRKAVRDALQNCLEDLDNRNCLDDIDGEEAKRVIETAAAEIGEQWFHDGWDE